MQWKVFFVEMSQAWAWPFVAAFIALLFKSEISKLLLRLRKFKHKETEFEFVEGVQELKKEMLTQGDVSNLNSLNSAQNQRRSALWSLAKISSRSAIVEAYRMVEAAIDQLAREYGTSLGEGRIHISRIFLANLLDKEVLEQLDQLKKLRNQAVHGEAFELSFSAVEDYLNLSLLMVEKLEEKNKAYIFK